MLDQPATHIGAILDRVAETQRDIVKAKLLPQAPRGAIKCRLAPMGMCATGIRP